MLPQHTLWWLSPLPVMLIMNTALLLIALAVPAEIYSALWRTPKHLDVHAAGVTVLMIAAWWLGYLLSARERCAQSQQPCALPDTRLTAKLFQVTFVLTLAGYVAVLVVAISRGLTPGMLIGALEGQKNVMQQLKGIYFATIPGLTTMTQFGPAAAIFGTLLAKTQGWKTMRCRFAILMTAAALRAFFISERLALLELAVPAIIVVARFWTITGSPLRRTLLRGLPVFAAIFLFGVFAASEYFRSWTNFYANRGEDFQTFATLRVAGYYTTAHNNSAYLLYHFDTPSIVPQFTAEWFWRFPGMRNLLGDDEDVALTRYREYMNLLRNGVNPEFNNSGGLLLPVIDFGVFGGLVYWFLAGIVSRKLYESYQHGRAAGVFLFPIFMLGLLEVSRMIYWTSGRTFPSFVALTVGYVLCMRRAWTQYEGAESALPSAPRSPLKGGATWPA